MSTTHPEAGPAADRASRGGGSASATSGGLASASPAETATVLALGIVPALVRGLFSPRRAAMKVLTRLDADGRAVAALRSIRARHDGVGMTLLGGRMVVLWGAGAIAEVLEQSADTYASDGGAKAKGMAHFQPDALTLSRGAQWRERRAFTESVLATGQPAHPMGEHFLRIVAEEVGAMGISDALNWSHWEGLFDRLTLRVIFGDRARGDQALTQALERLMGEANRLVGLKRGADYYELYAGLEGHLRDPDPDGLLGRFAGAPHSDTTRMIQQVPHWIFAMRDTLGANAFRALAAIVADPEVARRAREEIAGADLSDPSHVSGMAYLRGCLQEAMRLWPTTPLLARESTRETTLAGEQLAEGTQVMMLNVFNHRNPDDIPDADRLVPERWQTGERDMRFNHLSNGTQDCPGGDLVLLLGAAVLARVLVRYELTLDHPQLPGTPGAELPHMIDFYSERFSARGRPS